MNLDKIYKIKDHGYLTGRGCIVLEEGDLLCKIQAFPLENNEANSGWITKSHLVETDRTVKEEIMKDLEQAIKDKIITEGYFKNIKNTEITDQLGSEEKCFYGEDIKIKMISYREFGIDEGMQKVKK